jgi:hypothetical protein
LAATAATSITRNLRKRIILWKVCGPVTTECDGPVIHNNDFADLRTRSSKDDAMPGH